MDRTTDDIIVGFVLGCMATLAILGLTFLIAG